MDVGEFADRLEAVIEAVEGHQMRVAPVGARTEARRQRRRLVVVVQDGAGRLTVAQLDVGTVRRGGQRHREGFVRLGHRVAQHVHRDGLAGLARREGDRAVIGQEAARQIPGADRVAARAGDRVADRHLAGRVAGAGDREGEAGGAAVAFRLRQLARFDGDDRRKHVRRRAAGHREAPQAVGARVARRGVEGEHPRLVARLRQDEQTGGVAVAGGVAGPRDRVPAGLRPVDGFVAELRVEVPGRASGRAGGVGQHELEGVARPIRAAVGRHVVPGDDDGAGDRVQVVIDAVGALRGAARRRRPGAAPRIHVGQEGRDDRRGRGGQGVRRRSGGQRRVEGDAAVRVDVEAGVDLAEDVDAVREDRPDVDEGARPVIAAVKLVLAEAGGAAQAADQPRTDGGGRRQVHGLVGEAQFLHRGDAGDAVRLGAAGMGDGDRSAVVDDVVVRLRVGEDHRVLARAAVDVVGAAAGLEQVVAVAAVQRVVAGPAVQRVVARVAGQQVRPVAAAQAVVANAAGQAVVAAVAEQPVVAGLTAQPVRRVAAGQRVRVRGAGQVQAGGPHQHAGVALGLLKLVEAGQRQGGVGHAVAVHVEHDLGGGTAGGDEAEADLRAARLGHRAGEGSTAHEGEGNAGEVDPVARREVGDAVAVRLRHGGVAEAVVALAPAQHVLAGPAGQRVVAGPAGEEVRAAQAVQPVVAGTAGQRVGRRPASQRVRAVAARGGDGGHADQDAVVGRIGGQRVGAGQMDDTVRHTVTVHVELEVGGGEGAAAGVDVIHRHAAAEPLGQWRGAEEAGRQTGDVDAVARGEVGYQVAVDVGGASEDEGVVAGAAGQLVAAFRPNQRVVAVAARQRVVAGPAGQAVVAGPAGQSVAALAAVQRVVAVAAVQPVVAAKPLEPVVAAQAGQAVGALAAGQRLCRTGARQGLVGDTDQDARPVFPQGMAAGQLDHGVRNAVAVAVDLDAGALLALRAGYREADLGRAEIDGRAGKGPAADEGGVERRQVETVAVREVLDAVARGVARGQHAEGVVAGPAGQRIGPVAAEQRVVAVAAVQPVAARSAVQKVAAGRAGQRVVSGPAGQAVGVAGALEALAGGAEQDARRLRIDLKDMLSGDLDAAVGHAVAVQVDVEQRVPEARFAHRGHADLRAARAAEGVGADEVGVERRQVDAVAVREVGDAVARDVVRGEDEGVVAGPAGQAVGARPADQRVVAGIAGQRVVADAAGQAVVAAAAGQAVAPGAALQRLARVRSGEDEIVHADQDGGVVRPRHQGVRAGQDQHPLADAVAVHVEDQPGFGQRAAADDDGVHLGRAGLRDAAREGGGADEGDVHVAQVDAVVGTEIGDAVAVDVAGPVEAEGIPPGAAGHQIAAGAAVQRVVAVAALQRVDAVAADEGVVASPADDQVVSVIAAQRVVARTAGQRVRTGGAGQAVVAVRAGQGLPMLRDEDARRPRQFDQRHDTVDKHSRVADAVAVGVENDRRGVRAVVDAQFGAARNGRAAGERTFPEEARIQRRQVEPVAGTEVEDAVVVHRRRRAEDEPVVAGAAFQRVRPVAADQNVVTRTALEQVVAAQACQRVVARTARQSVAAGAARQGIVPVGAGQGLCRDTNEHAGRVRIGPEIMLAGQREEGVAEAVVGGDLHAGCAIGDDRAHLGRPVAAGVEGERFRADVDRVQRREVDAVPVPEVGDAVALQIVDAEVTEGVVALTTEELVGSCPALQRIVASAAAQQIRTRSAEEQVVAGPAVQAVAAAHAGQSVVAGATGQRIAAGPAFQRVAAVGPAPDHLRRPDQHARRVRIDEQGVRAR